MKEKAKELVQKFLPHMYCFMGSGMLSNTYDIDVAIDNAKVCAKILVAEMLDDVETMESVYFEKYTYRKEFWLGVEKEIENITSDNYK